MKKNKAGKGNREGPCDERRPPWENKICTEICTKCSSVNSVYILGNNMPGIEFSKFGGPETGACLMFWGTKEASVARDELSNRRSGLWRSHKGRQGLRSRGALFSAKQEAAGHFWVGEWHNLTSIKKKKNPSAWLYRPGPPICCWTELVKTHSYLVPSFKEKGFSLSEYLSVIPVSMMFAEGLFGRLLFIRLSKFSISTFFRGFIMDGCWILFVWFFILYSTNMALW